jgi:hypothetical protein
VVFGNNRLIVFCMTIGAAIMAGRVAVCSVFCQTKDGCRQRNCEITINCTTMAPVWPGSTLRNNKCNRPTTIHNRFPCRLSALPVKSSDSIVSTFAASHAFVNRVGQRLAEKLAFPTH